MLISLNIDFTALYSTRTPHQWEAVRADEGRDGVHGDVAFQLRPGQGWIRGSFHGSPQVIKLLHDHHGRVVLNSHQSENLTKNMNCLFYKSHRII